MGHWQGGHGRWHSRPRVGWCLKPWPGQCLDSCWVTTLPWLDGQHPPPPITLTAMHVAYSRPTHYIPQPTGATIPSPPPPPRSLQFLSSLLAPGSHPNHATLSLGLTRMEACGCKFRMDPKDTMVEWEWTCGGGQWRRLPSKIWGWVGAETLVSGEGSNRKARNTQAKVPLCVGEESGRLEHEPNCAEGLCWLRAPGGRQPLTRTGLSAQEGPFWGGGESLKAAFCVPAPSGPGYPPNPQVRQGHGPNSSY